MSLQTLGNYIPIHHDQVDDAQSAGLPLTLQKIKNFGHHILGPVPNAEREKVSPQRLKFVLPNCFSWGQKIVALGIMGLGLFGAQVEATVSTNQFPINTFQAGNQRDPSVAAFQGGGFVTTWGSFEQEVDDAGIFAQFFDKRGVKRGAEFQVNSYTNSRQWYPDVVGISNESAVFVWESFIQDGDRDGIFGQEVDFFGNPIGGEFPVNTFTTDYQEIPKIVACPNRDFLVAWISEEQDGSREGIYAQQFDTDRNPIGGEFRVHDETVNEQENPTILCLENQNFFFFWKSRHSGQTGIYGALFARGGIKMGQDFQVNNQSSLSSSSSLAVLPGANSDVIVFWRSSSPGGVFSQRYDQNGNPLGSESQLQNITSFEDAALLQNGEYVLATYIGSKIQVQRFGQNLNPIDLPIQVNTHPIGGRPKIAALDPEGFVVVWYAEDGDGSGIFGRLFHSNGTAVAIPRTGPGEWQYQPDLASFGNNTVVTWTNYDQYGSYEDVFAQILDENSNPTGEEFRVNSNREGSQFNPKPEKLNSEKFLMRWRHRPSELGNSGTFGQIYNLDGCRLEEQFLLDLMISNSSSATSSLVKSVGQGNFINAGIYYDFTQNPFRNSIVFQKYNESGNTIGEIQSFMINTTGSISFLVGTSIGLSDFAFVWRQSDGGEQLYGQLLTQQNQPVGTPFRIDTDDVSTTKRNPDANQLPNRGMVVTWDTWYHPSDDDQGGIYHQLYNADGTRLNGELRVNSNIIGDQERPSTATLSDGKYVIVWQSYGHDGSHYGIFGQLFLETGTPFGSEFRVNSYTLDSQKFPKADATGDGGFYVVWQSYQRTDNLTRVRGQKFDQDGNKIGPERQFPISLNATQVSRRNCVNSTFSTSSSELFSNPGIPPRTTEVSFPTVDPSESGNSNSTTLQQTQSFSEISNLSPSLVQQTLMSSNTFSNWSSELFESTTEQESSLSISSTERSLMSSYVTIEAIISGEVTMINHPIYGEITLHYDAGTHTLTIGLNISELENGDEIDLFTFASNVDVSGLNLVLDASSTCMRVERAEDSDQSIYVIRFIDETCTGNHGSLLEHSTATFNTLLALQTMV